MKTLSWVRAAYHVCGRGRVVCLVTALAVSVAGAACSGGDGGGGDVQIDAGADAAADAPPPIRRDGGPPTWSEIYAAYFAAGTPGHCGDSGCHGTSQGGFRCGTSAATCYQGLVAANLVDPSNPTMSAIADPNQTPLSWFGSGGNMPRDMQRTNSAAAADVGAWVAAGAKND